MLCMFCTKECKNDISLRSHQRLCAANPNKQQSNVRPWNKGLTTETDKRVKQHSELRRAIGCCTGRAATLETEQIRKQKLSIHAKTVLLGGYQANAGRSKKFKIVDSFGNQTTLQSTYEYAVFEILCELGIDWIRPKSLKYDGRNYFADFYLPEYDIWLDPKNDYKAKCDAEKIKKVIEQNNVKLYVLHKYQITKSYIASLAQR